MKIKKSIILFSIICVITIIGIFGYQKYQQYQRQESFDHWMGVLNTPSYQKKDIEYGSTLDISDLYLTNTVQVTVNQSIDSFQLGEQILTYTARIIDDYGQEIGITKELLVNVIDTEAPSIEIFNDQLYVYENGTIDLEENIGAVKDQVDGEVAYQINEDIDLSTPGTYEVKVSATDKSENQAIATFTVEVRESEMYPYYIRINRAANTVTIYTKGEEGTYSVPYKAMVCSTGRATPLGTYQMYGKYRWRALFGNVFGQYGMTIVGDILFHSVPYYAMNPSMLESEEYNKLGTAASLGCIRLCVKDVKWIYDNCPQGTTVTLYDDVENPGPLGKPESIKIDLTDERAGWDPTDPDEDNPWRI